MVATTDPAMLPDLTTWYLVTNLPAPVDDVEASPFSPTDLAEIVRLYRLRTWVEQNYKHVKHALGWSQYPTGCAPVCLLKQERLAEM